jgi:hypothetical protein
MKWNSVTFSLIFAAGTAAYPSVASAQTRNVETFRLTREDPARTLFDEGVKFQYEGKLVEAEQKFREALRRYPRAENADRTNFYLIDTLVKLRRIEAAKIELENLRKNYPGSKWQDDANEKIYSLGGQPRVAEAPIWNSAPEVRETQARANLMFGVSVPLGPAGRVYDPKFPHNASWNAEMLRLIIQLDPDGGIEDAKAFLKANPSDPAVMANLGNIANCDSPQRVPFLFSIFGNTAASPNMRNSAFFWFSRSNPNKEEVANTVMDLLAKADTEKIASEALFQLSVADHRAVLEKVVMSSRPDKFTLMKKIFKNGSPILKGDLLMFIGRLNDSRSVPFIVENAQNDPDSSVRRAGAQALTGRKDVDVETVRRLMNSAPPAPTRTTQPVRVPQQVPGSGVTPFMAIPSLPSTLP